MLITREYTPENAFALVMAECKTEDAIIKSFYTAAHKSGYRGLVKLLMPAFQRVIDKENKEAAYTRDR